MLVHIHNLRQKIEDDPSEPRYVVTEWGKGYLFPFDTTTRPLEEAR